MEQKRNKLLLEYDLFNGVGGYRRMDITGTVDVSYKADFESDKPYVEYGTVEITPKRKNSVVKVIYDWSVEQPGWNPPDAGYGYVLYKFKNGVWNKIKSGEL